MGGKSGYTPMRPMMSAKLTPLASTRMRTSPAFGVGSAASLTRSTSGGPARVIQICRTATTPSALGLLLEHNVVLERVGKLSPLALELQFEMGVAVAKVSDLLDRKSRRVGKE